MKRLLVGLCALTLAACSGNSGSGSSSGSTSGTSTSTTTGGSTGGSTTSTTSTTSSGTTSGTTSGSGSTGSGTTTTSGSGSSSTGSSSGSTGGSPPPFPINSEFYAKPLLDDAGMPLDSRVEYVGTDLTATCGQLRDPDAGVATPPFWLIAAVTESTDQVTPVATGTYSWNYLAPAPDAGFLAEVQMALQYPDGGGKNYVGVAGTVTWTTLSSTEASGSYDAQLIDYDASNSTHTLVDAGRVSGSFSNVSYCGP